MKERFRDLQRKAHLRIAARRAGVRRLGAFGEESIFLPPVTVRSPHRIEIGSRVLVSPNVSFFLTENHKGRTHNPRVRIGDGTVIGHGVWFSCVGEIEVGSDVLIGHNVLIADSFHEYADRTKPVIHQPMAPPRKVMIEPGAVIGPGAAILSGVTVGAGSYVAPNAVVAIDVPAFSVAAGNPATVIRRWDSKTESYEDHREPRWEGLLKVLSR